MSEVDVWQSVALAAMVVGWFTISFRMGALTGDVEREKQLNREGLNRILEKQKEVLETLRSCEK